MKSKKDIILSLIAVIAASISLGVRLAAVDSGKAPLTEVLFNINSLFMISIIGIGVYRFLKLKK